MAALVGVKYQNMSSQRGSERKHTKGVQKMSGRSGPPMVDVKRKSGQKKLVQPERKARGGRFTAFGSVSERSGRNVGGSEPKIGSPRGHGSFATEGIRKSR